MKNIDRRNIIFLLLCLLILLRPFISDEAFKDAGSLYKLSLFSIFLISLLTHSKSLFRNNPLNLPILFLILIYLFSLFYHRNFNNGIKNMFNLLGGVSLFYLVYSVDKNRINSVVKVIITASIIISIYGIYQYFWGFEKYLKYLSKFDPSILKRTHHYIEKILISKRVYSVFFSPNTLAGYLIIVIPLTCGEILKKLKYNKRNGFFLTFLGVVFIVPILTLFFTKSLLGILSFIISFGIFFFLVINFMIENKLLKRKLIWLSIIAGIVLLVLFGYVLFLRAQYTVDLHQLDWSIMQRKNYLISTLEIIKENPLIGVGLGNYGKAYLRFIQPGANVTLFAHNSYLQIWAETGLFSLLAFLSIMIPFLKKGILLIKRKNIYTGLSIGLLTGGLAFLIHCVVDNDFFISQVSYHWWIILGILMNLSKSNLNSQSNESKSYTF